MDKELGSLRKARWEKAFSDESIKSGDSSVKVDVVRDVNRKATIVSS